MNGNLGCPGEKQFSSAAGLAGIWQDHQVMGMHVISGCQMQGGMMVWKCSQGLATSGCPLWGGLTLPGADVTQVTSI
jgi:hypothetical protein